MGKSYGDPALNAENLLAPNTGKQILEMDPVTGIVEAESGVTLEDLWRHTLPLGWWLPVVSGTAKVSLGGAVSMNIHGKNNFKAGTFGEHVLGLQLHSPQGDFWLEPDDPRFAVVVSGAGLLGRVTKVRLQLKPVRSGDVRVHAVSCRNWDEQFAAFERFEGEAEYVVSWIDGFGAGAASGRGILHAAWHVEDPEPHTLHLEHQDLPPRIMGVFPKDQVWRVLKLLNNRPGMKLVNAAKHFAGKTREHEKTVVQSLAAFNFLLDYVPGWERSYAPGGLIQLQYFIPKERARETFARLLATTQSEGLESFLIVMKRHRLDRLPFVFSHAVDGYSLAMDFKVIEENRARLLRMAHAMNEMALEAGGRFYFAKDATLTADQAHRFLGHDLERFREAKRELDPEGLIASDLSRRLKLI